MRPRRPRRASLGGARLLANAEAEAPVNEPDEIPGLRQHGRYAEAIRAEGACRDLAEVRHALSIAPGIPLLDPAFASQCSHCSSGGLSRLKAAKGNSAFSFSPDRLARTSYRARATYGSSP